MELIDTYGVIQKYPVKNNRVLLRKVVNLKNFHSTHNQGHAARKDVR